MWGKLQTHGDKKNDAEVLAIAAAGAPLDVMAMFFESHIEELKQRTRNTPRAPAAKESWQPPLRSRSITT